jgi:type II restriction/modification system DNA methylase subunit YeeA
MFQKSVLKNTSQDESLVATRWVEYQKYLTKIDYIKKVKEEKFQTEFLQLIFENCLGYTLDSSDPSNFNLEREKKNETDGKKADGVISVNNEIVGIVELKGQDTKNLDKIEIQAFNYHNSHSNSKYIIISNFDELRLYIDKKTAYEKFSLFNLTYEDFKKFHLLLSYESIKENIPQKLKDKTATFEQDISKELYKDFSIFRNHLFENLVKNNTEIEKALLLRLTQKLCDRIIFILFAEDRGLLSPNTIKEIREEFANQRFTDYSLYDMYKFYFDAVNNGNSKLNIPKYNGGLFANDTVLDNLIIDDTVLDMEAQKLSDYDFESDIGVNILGHIFEQSLTDLEEINANINDTDFDKTKTKRKKDGVFYTPEYITKYIVDNTLGKMCLEKREELNISNVSAPKNTKKLNKTEQQTKDNLETYKEWLFNLKILDPACGSGAFLNQALEHLIKEHTNLQNDLSLMGDLFAVYTVEESVLENNIYGVDINEDAVEIAKLSLWLRTAKKGRPLTKLADKILCANSLLEMPFEEGIFDIIIGNPPYVRHEMIKEIKPQLKEKYKTFVGTADLYVYFYELGFNMLKQNGLKGYICSNKFFRAKYGEKLRELILSNMTINEIADFNGVKIFEDATVDSTITILKKDTPKKDTTFKMVDIDLLNHFEMAQNDLSKLNFTFISPQTLKIKKKVEKLGLPLKEWDIDINYGIKTGFNEAYIIDTETKNSLINKDKKNKEIINPILRGRDIRKYDYLFADKWLINVHNNPPVCIEEYPTIKDYLNIHYEKLSKRSDKGKTVYHLRSCAYLDKLEREKIIYPETTVRRSEFVYDNSGLYLDKTCFFISGKSLKYLNGLLNSKLIEFYLESNLRVVGKTTVQYSKQYIVELPIPILDIEKQKPFIDLVNLILNSKQKIKDYQLLYEDAVKNDNFDREIKLKNEIENFEKVVVNSENEIDNMVYELYGLSDEEIKLVE